MNPRQHCLNGGRAAPALGRWFDSASPCNGEPRARILQGTAVDFGRKNGLEAIKHCVQGKSVWTARQAGTVNPSIMR